jgi:hypothetical protein
MLNLGIKVRGTPLPSLYLKDLGDMDFERSREAARVKLDNATEEVRTKQDSVRLGFLIIRKPSIAPSAIQTLFDSVANAVNKYSGLLR